MRAERDRGSAGLTLAVFYHGDLAQGELVKTLINHAHIDGSLGLELLHCGGAIAGVAENYDPNQPQLAAIKKQYDPGNLFRLNANVKPAA